MLAELYLEHRNDKRMYAACHEEMAAAQPTVILRQKKTDDGTQKKQAPLKLSLPASWIDAPCLKLLDTWGKKKKLRSEALCLEAGDGTPIPEEWPIEAALMLYGEEDDDEVPHATLFVAPREEADALRAAATAEALRMLCLCCFQDKAAYQAWLQAAMGPADRSEEARQ